MSVKHISKRNHALTRPDMYIGAEIQTKQNKWIATKDKIQYKTMLFNEGLMHIFIEALSNAQDNYFRSINSKTPLKTIKVTVEDNTVTVWNDGMHVSVKTHEWGEDEEKLTGKDFYYEPELIFGHMLTSTNFDDTSNARTGLGLNGIGIKATNIFSKMFEITLVDPVLQKKFVHTWTNNMIPDGEPKITASKLKGFTQVKYIADFNRFKIKGYTKQFIAAMRKLCIDCAMITGATVIFNGEKLPVKTLKDYANYYIDENTKKLEFTTTDSKIVFCEKPETAKNGDLPFHISFVNGGYTPAGGVHVDAWSDAILKPLLQKIKKKYEKKTQIKLTKKKLQEYFFIFINCNLKNPRFEGQQKKKVVNPEPTVKIIDSKINQLLKWDFMQDIEALLLAQNMKAAKKTDGKKSRNVNVPKLTDANKAGTKDSTKCTLFITEGDSAKTFAISGIASLKNGQDFNGALPIKGKILNVRDATVKSISNNAEIKSIKITLGLRQGVDYTSDANFNTLRYGKVCILTDADKDGDHIKGLLINFFHKLYPSLYSRDYIVGLRTPILKLQGKQKQHFYFKQDFYAWQESHPNVNTNNIKYYKGLGTSSKVEAVEVFKNPRNVCYKLDAKASESIIKVFSKKKANERKKWLDEYSPPNFDYPVVNGVEQSAVTKFIDNEFREFSMYDNYRSIPSAIDGLKPSQRKALWAAFKKLNKETKVAIFSSEASGLSHYEHGETSLQQTFIGMTQTFVGSNNISYFTECGEFGTRLKGGDDAASARYITLKENPLIRYIFRKEDDFVLDYNMSEDNDFIEPKYYVPIIPIALVNGAHGIGTGYSTHVPKYNPKDLVSWILNWIETEKSDDTVTQQPLVPWYRGFTGITEIVKNKVYHYGIYEDLGRNKWRITELPIGVWTEDYEEKVIKKMKDSTSENKKNYKMAGAITAYSQYNTPFNVDFRFTTKPGVTVDYDSDDFKLVSTESLNNLTAWNSENKITKYATPEDIIAEFCSVRLNLYNTRRTKQIATLKVEIKEFDSKIRFIDAVIGGFKINKYTDSDLNKWFADNKYYKKDKSYDYLTNISLKSFTKNNIERLRKKLSDTQKLLKKIQKTSTIDMWKSELKEFLVEYEKWLKQLELIVTQVNN